MLRRSSLALLLSLTALAGACQSAFDPLDGEAPIQTDSAVYHVRTTQIGYELTIGATFTNPTGSRVYIPTCNTPHPPVLEKREGGRWVTAYAPAVSLCLGPPLVIEAGQSYTYTYRVFAGFPGNNHYPQFTVADLAGTYRLRWEILDTWDPDRIGPGLGKPLSLEYTISNPFEITL